MEFLAAEGESLILLIHDYISAAGYAAASHSSCYNGRMGGHSSSYRKDTLRRLHARYILGRGLEPYKYHLLASCVPGLCVISGENYLTAGGSG